MKKLILILLLTVLSVNVSLSQTRFGKDESVKFVLTFAAGQSYVNTNSDQFTEQELSINNVKNTFNYEFRLGVEKTFDDNTNGFRAGIQYERGDNIGFSKCVLTLDYMLKDHLLFFPIDNFNQYVGVQFGPTWRDLNSVEWVDPEIHHSTTWYNPGVNFEIEYMLTDNIGANVNFNWYRAESYLIKYDIQTRKDLMFGITAKL